jgi:hypothetical protein
LLQKAFEKIGITDYSFDDFRIETFDERRTLSYWDVPPGDSFYDIPDAIVYDATNDRAWIGIKDRLYYRILSTYDYVLCGAVTSGYKIVRLWSDDVANGNIWGLEQNEAGAFKIIKYVITTSTLTYYTITRTESPALGGEVNFAFDLSGRGIYYLCTTLGVCKFLLDTLTEISSNLIGDANTWYPGSLDASGNYLFQISTGMRKVKYSGSWSYSDVTWPGDAYIISWNAIYNKTLGLWFAAWHDEMYGDPLEGYCILAWDLTANTIAYHSDHDLKENVRFISDEIHGLVYMITNMGSVKIMDASTYSVVGDPIPIGFNTANKNVISQSLTCYDSSRDRLVGICYGGSLFEFGIEASMYLEREADFEGQTIFDAMKELCIGFQLLPRVRMTKTAQIYRRFDGDGDPVTTGDSVTLNADVAKNLSEETGYGEACDVVVVDNSDAKELYDVAGFDAVALGDDKELTISSRFIPTALLKDYAYLYYPYHSTSKTRYMVPTPLIPYFQYEPVDGAALNFTGKIPITSNGIIIGQNISRDGTTEFEVIV